MLLFNLWMTAAVIAAMIIWQVVRWIRVVRASRYEFTVPAYHAAYLRGGPKAAILASVAMLYTAGVVKLGPRPLPPAREWPLKRNGRLLSGLPLPLGRVLPGLVAAAPLPADHHPLDAAVHQELRLAQVLQIDAS